MIFRHRRQYNNCRFFVINERLVVQDSFTFSETQAVQYRCSRIRRTHPIVDQKLNRPHSPITFSTVVIRSKHYCPCSILRNLLFLETAVCGQYTERSNCDENRYPGPDAVLRSPVSSWYECAGENQPGCLRRPIARVLAGPMYRQLDRTADRNTMVQRAISHRCQLVQVRFRP